MAKVMMIYDVAQDTSKRIALNRKLFNYNLQSHGGKYKRKSKGLLLKYEKPIRSCIIFDDQFLDETKALCKKLKVKFKLYRIMQL